MNTSFNSKLDKIFKLKEHNTTVKTEVIAGITTFVTMAYILAVNPDTLAISGMDKGAVFTATALASVIATLLMGFYANLPFGLSAGMGINVFFSITVVKHMGHTWQFALAAVFIEGIIFILLSIFKVREYIVNGMPTVIKSSVACGIGIFIAFIGLKSAGLVKANSETIVELGNLTSPTSIVCLVGIFVILGLTIAKVKGAILIGIISATVVAVLLNVTSLPSAIVSLPPSVESTAFAFTQFSMKELFSLDMLIVVFTFLFVDMFDTIGTLIGTATKADMLDKDGNLPNAGKALFADAVGTTVGAMLGTSTVTTFVESSAGIAEGGRTGLTAITTGVLFIVSLFFAPLFLMIPGAATSSALIVVGLFMFGSVAKIDFNDFTEGFPAFITVIMMPFTGSIGDGLMLGIISYVLCKLVGRRYKEVSIFMYILAIIFTIKFILHFI